ncbi:MAG: hypothetical protein IMW89_14530 [Ktedonobacteraceae bacterium]|nr:hypothetical protein [Ktedonobacteraceae bacterium]
MHYNSIPYNMNARQVRPPQPLSSRHNRVQGARAAKPSPGQRTGRLRSRRTFLLLLLAGIVITASLLVAADFQKSGSTLQVQVGNQQAALLDLNQGVSISPYLLGSNAFPKAGSRAKDPQGRGFMNYSDQVQQGLRSASVKLLRYPGGNWGEEHTLSAEQLNDFSNLLNQVGAEGMLQAQLSDPLDVTPVPLQKRATRAALLVDYMNNSKSIQRIGTNIPFHRIAYWTVGNEPDLLTNPDTRQKYTASEYADAFITYSLAMHEKDPTIKIFGPEISHYQGPNSLKDRQGKPWMETFLQTIAQYERTHNLSFHLIDGVSFHYYPLGNTGGNTNTLANDPAQWSTSLPPLRQFIRQQFGRDIPLAITEINANSGGPLPAQASSTLWWADTLGKLMSNWVEYVTFFSTEGVNNPYPLFTGKDLKETAMLRVMQLFARLQPRFIPAQDSSGPVSIYATRDNNQNIVSLLLINKTTQAQHIRVQAGSIIPFGQWHNADLTLQGQTIAMLTLHRNGRNEALGFSTIPDTQQPVPDIQPIPLR